jgi:hypothetical protein
VALFDVGDDARTSCAFTNDAGAAADPTGVSVTIDPPGAGTVTYTYPAAEVVKDSTGNYHVDFTCDAPGRWWIRWVGTGAVAAADTVNFLVNA